MCVFHPGTTRWCGLQSCVLEATEIPPCIQPLHDSCTKQGFRQKQTNQNKSFLAKWKPHGFGIGVWGCFRACGIEFVSDKIGHFGKNSGGARGGFHNICRQRQSTDSGRTAVYFMEGLMSNLAEEANKVKVCPHLGTGPGTKGTNLTQTRPCPQGAHSRR